MIAPDSLAAGLLQRAHRAERTRIVDCADEEAARAAGAKVPSHRFEALAELAVAFEICHLRILELRTGFLHPHEHAGQPHLGKTARAFERQQDDLGDLRRAMLLGPAPEVTAADQSGFVVVGAEVGRAGVRHLDRDERDVRFAVLGGDDRGDVLVGLELDDEVHFLAHEDVGVALRDLGAVAVVDADELDALGRRGPLQAGRDLLRELVVGALRGVAKPIGPLLEADAGASDTGSRRPSRSSRSVRGCTAAGTPCSSAARFAPPLRAAAVPRRTSGMRTAAATSGRPT